MLHEGKCPECGCDTFITKKITLSWLDVAGSLLVSIFVFYLLYLILSGMHGHSGKFVSYLIFGCVGLVGWIFTYFVKKETFLVESCTRCDFKKSIKVIPTEGSLDK